MTRIVSHAFADVLGAKFEITDEGRAALLANETWRVAAAAVVAGLLICAIVLGLLMLATGGGR